MSEHWWENMKMVSTPPSSRIVAEGYAYSPWRRMYFAGTDHVPDTIDIPCEVVEDKQLPESTETPKP